MILAALARWKSELAGACPCVVLAVNLLNDQLRVLHLHRVACSGVVCLLLPGMTTGYLPSQRRAFSRSRQQGALREAVP